MRMSYCEIAFFFFCWMTSDMIIFILQAQFQKIISTNLVGAKCICCIKGPIFPRKLVSGKVWMLCIQCWKCICQIISIYLGNQPVCLLSLHQEIDICFHAIQKLIQIFIMKILNDGNSHKNNLQKMTYKQKWLFLSMNCYMVKDD